MANTTKTLLNNLGINMEDFKIMNIIEGVFEEDEYDEEVEGIVSDIVFTRQQRTDEEGWNG